MTEWKASVHNGNTKAIMICDFISCGAMMDFPMRGSSIDFDGGTVAARSGGWRVWTEDKHWKHLCPEHAK